MQVKNFHEAAAFRDDKMAKVTLFESQRFFCDLYCLKPGQAQKAHAHEESDKLYAILRGEGEVMVGNEKRTLKAGEIVLAPAGEPHGIANESEAELVCLVFMAPHPSFNAR